MTATAIPTRRRSFKWRRRTGTVFGRILIYLLVVAGSVVFMFPFVWALASSGKSYKEVTAYPPYLWPKDAIFVHNYTQIWIDQPFLRWILNSFYVTGLTLIGSISSASLVAYAYARFDFPLKNFWFFVMLSTMMLPFEVTLIPSYLIYQAIGWIDSYKPLIVPAFFGGGAFNIFLLRQFYMTIPRDLDEAAEIDGAGVLQIYFRVLLPLSKPVIATAAALGFIGSWSSFMGPLIYINSQEKFTATVGLRFYVVATRALQYGSAQLAENLFMGAAIIVALPCLILFFVAQKYFVQGIATTGLKG